MSKWVHHNKCTGGHAFTEVDGKTYCLGQTDPYFELEVFVDECKNCPRLLKNNEEKIDEYCEKECEHMQIVIDISEEKYQWIKKHEGVTDFKVSEILYDSVRNGTDLLDYVMQSIEAEKKAMRNSHDLASEEYHKGIIYAFECMKMKLM